MGKPPERQSVLNRGSEWLTPRLKTEYPCLSELLRTLQAIQRKWITPPTWGDNHWEFQPLFFNPNLNDKKYSKKRGYLIPEDFGFKNYQQRYLRSQHNHPPLKVGTGRNYPTYSRTRLKNR